MVNRYAAIRLFTIIATQRNTVINSIRVSLIVGLILNLINQGDLIIQWKWEEINLFKFFLTFMVPFLVSTYASSSTKTRLYIGSPSPVRALIECPNCEKHLMVEENEMLIKCPGCQKNRRWKLIKYWNENDPI